MRPLLILLAALVAVVLPAAADAQWRGGGGGGFFRPSFERFHPRFERMPPRGPFLPRRFAPPPPFGPRPAARPPPPGPDGYPSAHAFADWREQQDAARMQVRQGKIAPLDDVVVTLRRRAPGRLLDTQLTQDGGRATYHVQWVTEQGRRVDYVVDAATGRVLSER